MSRAEHFSEMTMVRIVDVVQLLSHVQLFVAPMLSPRGCKESDMTW